MNESSLRERRAALGLSQRGMADYLGVPYDTYRNWEVGRRLPRGNTALALSAAIAAGEVARRNGQGLPDWRAMLGRLGEAATQGATGGGAS